MPSGFLETHHNASSLSYGMLLANTKLDLPRTSFGHSAQGLQSYSRLIHTIIQYTISYFSDIQIFLCVVPVNFRPAMVFLRAWEPIKYAILKTAQVMIVRQRPARAPHPHWLESPHLPKVSFVSHCFIILQTALAIPTKDCTSSGGLRHPHRTKELAGVHSVRRGTHEQSPRGQ